MILIPKDDDDDDDDGVVPLNIVNWYILCVGLNQHRPNKAGAINFLFILRLILARLSGSLVIGGDDFHRFISQQKVMDWPHFE